MMKKSKRGSIIFVVTVFLFLAVVAVAFYFSKVDRAEQSNTSLQQLEEGSNEKDDQNNVETETVARYPNDIKVSDTEESRYLYPYATWDVYYGEGVGFDLDFPRDWVAVKIEKMQSEHSSGVRLIGPQSLEGVDNPSLNNYEKITEDISVYYFDSISEEVTNKTKGYDATTLDELIAKEGSIKIRETQVSDKIKETEVIKKGKTDIYTIYFEKGKWLYEINFNHRARREMLTDIEWQILYSFSPKSDASELSHQTWDKPIIYLYPAKPQDVKVSLDFEGALIAAYPAYVNGWNVFAYPDGKLIDSTDSREYSYLFWEGIPDTTISYDLTKGFIIEGKDTATFLQDILSKMGLTPKEYNEFIVYWMPRMQDNKYNLIHFASKEEYDDHARLTIEPKPDSILRVFMVYKPLNEWQKIEPQETKSFARNGFTVVEWGGSEIK